MASNDFIDNAISSKVDETAINELVGSLDPTSAAPQNLAQFPAQGGGGQRMIVRTVTGQQVVRQQVAGQQNAAQVSRVPQLPTQPNIIRTASGQMVMASGQRIVGPGQPGTIMLARPPSSQQPQTATTPSYAGGQVMQQVAMGGQIVRTSSGQQIIVGGPGARPGQPGQPPGQQQPIRPGMQQQGQNPQQVIQKVVINQPGTRPGQPGSQITVPLQTLQALQAGQGIPTGQPGHLLVKTETGQYQILRVGPPGTQPTPAGAQPTPTSTPVQVPQAPRPSISTPVSLPTRPAVVTSSASRPPTAPPPRLPTAPLPVSRAPAPPPASTAAASAASMGQQMTPDTAKVKCKNFLATLLRLASDQPESVARNVRALIQELIDGRVEPEVFTTKLQKELNSSPQPCLVPFLKKSLPYLRHSLATRELSIEGILPASPQVSIQNVKVKSSSTDLPGTKPRAITKSSTAQKAMAMPKNINAPDTKPRTITTLTGLELIQETYSYGQKIKEDKNGHESDLDQYTRFSDERKFESVTCCICGLEFKEVEEFRKHSRILHPFACSHGECQKRFTTHKNLYGHLAKDHSIRRFGVDILFHRGWLGNMECNGEGHPSEKKVEKQVEKKAAERQVEKKSAENQVKKKSDKKSLGNEDQKKTAENQVEIKAAKKLVGKKPTEEKVEKETAMKQIEKNGTKKKEEKKAAENHDDDGWDSNSSFVAPWEKPKRKRMTKKKAKANKVDANPRKSCYPPPRIG